MDLLEDFLGVVGRSDILNYLSGFKEKCLVVFESVLIEVVENFFFGKFM